MHFNITHLIFLKLLYTGKKRIKKSKVIRKDIFSVLFIVLAILTKSRHKKWTGGMLGVGWVLFMVVGCVAGFHVAWVGGQK